MQPADLKSAIASADKSGIDALVDAFFDGLITKYTGNPVAVALLKSAKGAVDGVLLAWGI